MERRQTVKPVKVSLYCDKCSGEMAPDGRMLTSNPPQYPHVCCKCGHVANVRGKTYPYIEYE